MSSGYQQHFTPADIEMLDRILERAAIYNRPETPQSGKRLEAARFLIKSFQQGIQTEAALLFALQSRQHFVVSSPECDVVRKARSTQPKPVKKAA